MSGWDEGNVFFSDAINPAEDRAQQRTYSARQFYDFIRTFRVDNTAIYRETLRRHYNSGNYYLEIDLDHLRSFDEFLADGLVAQPQEYMPLLEKAATDAADQITSPRSAEAADLQQVQVTLKSSANTTSLRALGSASMNKLVKIQGIIISASATRAKATTLTIQCRNCRNTKQIPVRPGFSGAQLPRRCDHTPITDDEQRCPLDPYMIVPDKSVCVDQQTLKLQESPEMVPTGEMPRHMLLSADRYLTERVIPGTRCTITGMYTVFQQKKSGGAIAVRQPYIRVFGIHVDTAGAGRIESNFTAEEEEEFERLANQPDVYERIANSIAPSIYGSDDMKRAVACLLFGGSTKLLPDGMRLRGDINVLLLGDPGTAKSQLLKFSEKVAPIGVYTSGKGSSAAGLTASVIRDASSREFYLEGGAMVLADGGIVCIDEFDKMRESDRVAIHEAMEQQTISIAKAGITTTLNSRTSVLAAANSVFGRWDDTKSTDENIEFQSTILSRFDLIFIVKDEHDEDRDQMLARHVMGVHLNAEESAVEGELSVEFLKKFIQFCRTRCGPRLSEEAVEKLRNHFVQIRSETKKQEREADARAAIPITVRQLEAIVRISEALAKMELQRFATDKHVDEALRLFKVSTLSAALSSSGGDGDFTLEEAMKVEQALKLRFPVGSSVSESRIVNDLLRSHFPEAIVRKVISVMLRRGELEHQMQRRLLYRIK